MSKEEIAELKAKIHEQVEKLDDEIALQMLQEAVSAYSTPFQKDILDELSSEQFQRLSESIRQANEGKTLTNDEVRQKVREWLSK